MSSNVKKKNYFKECLSGVISAFIGTLFCTIGYGIGTNLEERQWLGVFDWYGFLVILIGGLFGQTLQLLIITELLRL